MFYHYWWIKMIIKICIRNLLHPRTHMCITQRMMLICRNDEYFSCLHMGSSILVVGFLPLDYFLATPLIKSCTLSPRKEDWASLGTCYAWVMADDQRRVGKQIRRSPEKELDWHRTSKIWRDLAWPGRSATACCVSTEKNGVGVCPTRDERRHGHLVMVMILQHCSKKHHATTFSMISWTI